MRSTPTPAETFRTVTFADPAAAERRADALEGLSRSLVAFPDTHHHLERIARRKGREVGAGFRARCQRACQGHPLQSVSRSVDSRSDTILPTRTRAPARDPVPSSRVSRSASALRHASIAA